MVDVIDAAAVVVVVASVFVEEVAMVKVVTL